jgi:hypothetical protein
MPLHSRGSVRPRRRARPAERGHNAARRATVVQWCTGRDAERDPRGNCRADRGALASPARHSRHTRRHNEKIGGEQLARRSFSVRLAINNRAGLGRHAHSRCVVLPTQRTRAGPSPAGTPRTAPRFAVGVDRVAGAADRVGEVGRGNGCRSRAHAHATCSTCARWMPPHSCTRAMLTSPRDTKSHTLPYRIRFLRRQQHACKALLERTWGTSVRAIARSADASLGAAMTHMHR